jgi:hypothetical protein
MDRYPKFLLVVCLGAVPVLVAAAPPCPPVIASLLPRAAVHGSGMWQGQGIVFMGGGSADLPFTHRCLSDKFPAKLSLEVQRYVGEAEQLLAMQVEGFEQQVLQSEQAECERRQKKMNNAVKVNPTRNEALGNGRVVIFSYLRKCPYGGVADNFNPDAYPVPHVRLKGVAHTASARLTITIEGDITEELALAAAKEVFANLAALRFPSSQ